MNKKRALWNLDISTEKQENLEEKTVFQEELEHIKARRENKYSASSDIDPTQDLVGLAFSGGGIRSATFGLGVLEALKEQNLLNKIDYLSTVSGGGYIGAWLSANCKRAVDCDVRAYFVSDNVNKQALIEQIKTEFIQNNNFTLIFIALETNLPDNPKQWVAAGFDKNNDFKEIAIDSDQKELIAELDKIQLKKVTADEQKKPKQTSIIQIDLTQKDVNNYILIKHAPPAVKSRQRADWLNPESKWGKSIDHLRRNSNYLSPKLGFFSADTWTIAMVWMRNTLLIQLLLFLTIALLLISPRALFFFFQDLSSNAIHWLTIIITIFVGAGIATNLHRINQPESWFLKICNWWKGFLLAILALSFAWLIAASENQYHFLSIDIKSLSMAAKIVISFFLVFSGFFLLPTVIMLMNKFKPNKNNKIKQINYTQNYVQLFVAAPILIASLFISAILQNNFSDYTKNDYEFSGIFINCWNNWPLSILILFASLWLFSISTIRKFNKETHTYKRLYVSLFIAPVSSALLLQVLLSAILFILQNWMTIEDEGDWISFVWGAPLILYAFSLTTVLMLGMIGRESSEAVREWWSRYSAWLAIYGFCWMVIVIITIYGPLLGAILIEHKYLGGSISFGWVITTLTGLIMSKSDPVSNLSKKSDFNYKEIIAKVAPFIFIIGLLLVISMALHLTISINSGDSIENLKTDHWWLLSGATPTVTGTIILCFILSGTLLSYRIDINEFSLNAFYRSRLVRCYLGATRFRKKQRQPQYFTGFDEKDDIKLSELIDYKEHYPPHGPFHIINCALNLGGSKDLALHTRHSAIFTLTPLRCGSSYKSKDHLGYRGGQEEEIGYIATNVFGGINTQPTLGQAISISGAAASPNMGYNTSPILAFLMTLFNARLGWWFPNPNKPSTSLPSPRFSLPYLLKELFGVANEKSDFLAISDGGHFENLAAYELIKRKCKVIIISDGECDPNLQFEGLGRLIRMCEVDLSTKISIDVSSIQEDKNSGWSRNRCAIGQIKYPDSTNLNEIKQGWLIYLKASMNGFEDTAIQQYKTTHTTFPHETTGDQFYGEDQFESYRQLGKDIAEKVFSQVAKENDFLSKAKNLNHICSPILANVEKFSKHGHRLMELWSDLSKNTDLNDLDKELNNSWPDKPKTNFRSIYYICSEMIQLMENVYLDLNLEETWNHPDTRGWRTLFIHWTQSKSIQNTWELSKNTYGSRFQFFWEREFPSFNNAKSKNKDHEN